MQGLTIDGNIDPHETDPFCYWDMVTGPSGTFLRTIDITHDLLDWAHHPNLPIENFMMNWYYDNDTPLSDDGGNEDTPLYPNGWSLCSARINNQVRKLTI